MDLAFDLAMGSGGAVLETVKDVSEVIDDGSGAVVKVFFDLVGIKDFLWVVAMGVQYFE